MPRKKPRHNYNNLSNRWWFWLIILTIIITVIGGIGLWYQLSHKKTWDGKTRLNIAIINNHNPDLAPIHIFSIEDFEPTVNPYKVIDISLPPEVLFNVAHGYGPYMVSALFGLSQQEQNINLITNTLSYELGIPINGYIINNQDLNQNLNNLALTWWIKNNKSNFTWADQFTIWWKLRNFRPDQINSLNFQHANWAKSEEEIDGQKIISFDKNTVDSRLPDLTYDTQIKNEQHTIRVTNSTGINGLGSQISRIIKGTGAHIVEITNNNQPIGQCSIETSKDKVDSYTVQKLKNIFDCQTTISQLKDNNRADIQFNVGFEQAYIWLGKK